ncbi:MAG: carboxylating nicotinate-nucleotide diphosphorylase [Deltaproteobacteria bacterium]|nr:carboxylating nicotinate-nucleotide diphosphorylase [Deltaproteobacteria bacterium]
MDMRALVREALREDIPVGDITTASIVPDDMKGKAVLIVREECVISGLEVFASVFEELGGVDIEFNANDGDILPANTEAAYLKGSLVSILRGERTALNFIMHLSGVATLTRRYVDAVEGTGVKIVDTRKTLPLMRILEKKAVRDGGGYNHRFSLSDGVLIKDNHIAVAGSVRKAVEFARSGAHHLVKIEVEVQKLFQIEEAIEAGADVIMLDNMESEDIRRAIEIVRGRVKVEVSGGINLDNIRKIAEYRPDFISVGRITHSAKSIDMSLEVLRKKKD